MGMSRAGDPDEHQMPRPPRPLAHTDQGVEATGKPRKLRQESWDMRGAGETDGGTRFRVG